MKYITEKDILIIHAILIEEIGGSYGVRDVGVIKSAVARVKTTVNKKETFPTVFEKGAAYLDSIARHHAFVDGNKRTAIAVASQFLYRNGFEVNVSNEEMVRFVILVATKHLEIKEIALWLKENSKKSLPKSNS